MPDVSDCFCRESDADGIDDGKGEVMSTIAVRFQAFFHRASTLRKLAGLGGVVLYLLILFLFFGAYTHAEVEGEDSRMLTTAAPVESPVARAETLRREQPRQTEPAQRAHVREPNAEDVIREFRREYPDEFDTLLQFLREKKSQASQRKAGS